MTDRSFHQLLYQEAAQLPPETVGQDPPSPWRKPLWRVCWGLALTTITLNFLCLQYILPALGSVLLYLGFRALWRENGWLQLGCGLSALLLLGRGAVAVLQATPANQWLYSQYGSLVGVALALVAWLLYFTLWRGLKGVFRKAGQTPETRSAGGLVVWYSLVLLLALVGSAGLLIWLLLLLWALLLRGLYRTSRALDQAGYAIVPSPVRVSGRQLGLFYLIALTAGILICLFFFRRLPVNETSAQLETGQEILRAELVELGFPEEVLTDLTDGEVALLEEARTVEVSSSVSQDRDTDDELHRLFMRMVQVELPDNRVRYFLWFSWEEAPSHRLWEGLEIQPGHSDVLTMLHSAPILGRLLWEEDGQLFQAPISGSSGIRTQDNIFFGATAYNFFAFHFSLPARGECIRGYVSYEMATRHPGEPNAVSFLANYVHQESWLNYPWESPIQCLQRGSWSSTDVIFPIRQFMDSFLLNGDGIEEK